MFRFLLAILFGAFAISFHASAREGDWLRFRGPNGSGIAEESTPTPVSWSATENLKWKVALPGQGSSCPIVVGDRVFVTSWSGYGTNREEDPGDQEALLRHLTCYDRETGNKIWDKTVAPYLPEDEYRGMFAEHGYASHTPVSDGERVYVFFGKTGVLAFDMKGNQLWHTSVGTESGAKNWGSSSSPILYKNLLIVPATAESEALVALDKVSGNEVWRQEASGFNSVWGTPILVEIDENRTDIVMSVPGEIWGFNPETGKLRWYCEAPMSNSACSSVVGKDGVVYSLETGPSGGGGIAVRVGGKGDVTDTHVVWAGNQPGRICSPIAYDGKIFAFSRGVANCFDATTGDEVFQARLKASSPGAQSTDDREDGRRRGRRGRRGGRGQDYSSPVLADGKIYFVSRGGDMYVIQPGDKFKQLAVNRVTSDPEDFSATPAVSRGDLFIRSNKHLYCVSDSN